MSEVRNQIEALLFSSGKKMSVDDISALTNIDKRTVKKGLNELKEFYDGLGSSLMVTEEGTLWKLNTRERYVSLVVKIISDTELSMPVLETLAVIAWKSPVLQSDVIKIRSASAYDHISELVEAGFVNKNKEGRSYQLKITEKFFEYFDVPGDTGIKEAFKAIQIPEKKEPEKDIEPEHPAEKEEQTKLGSLNVVPVDNDSIEHGKTAEIFGKHSVVDSKALAEEAVEEESDTKDEIPPVDEDFLANINSRIDELSKKNDELDKDELFKRPSLSQEGNEEGLEVGSEEVESAENAEDSEEVEGESEEVLVDTEESNETFKDEPSEDEDSELDEDSEEEKENALS